MTTVIEEAMREKDREGMLIAADFLEEAGLPVQAAWRRLKVKVLASGGLYLFFTGRRRGRWRVSLTDSWVKGMAIVRAYSPDHPHLYCLWPGTDVTWSCAAKGQRTDLLHYPYLTDLRGAPPGGLEDAVVSCLNAAGPVNAP